MNRTKKVCGMLPVAFIAALGGCKAADEVTLKGITGKDVTTGAINGVERKHAWIVAGVDGQSVSLDISVRNSQRSTNTPLDVNSVRLQGTDQYFTMQRYDEDSLDKFQSAKLTLNYPPMSLPLLNYETKTRVIPYKVEASYGATPLTSQVGHVEVLRPYCEVDAEPFSTLGMTFEIPNGAAPAGGWPTVLFVHGGGLNKRNHVDMEAYAAYMREEGYAVANMNYRLVGTPDVSQIYSVATDWRDPVADVKCAIRYLKENSSILGVNPTKIGMVGHSSGANIALEAAMTVNSSLPEFAEQGTPVHLGAVAGQFDTSVAALFTMDAIVNFTVFWDIFFESADALLEANFSILSEKDKLELRRITVTDFVVEQTQINGFGPQSQDWQSHPYAIAQDVVNYVNAQTDLPIFMQHSALNLARRVELYGVPFSLKKAPYHSWKAGCTFYNAIASAGSSRQRSQTFIKDNPETTHNDFVQNKKTVSEMSNDMTGFFDFYLKQQGARPVTGFDYGRCANVE